MSGPRQDPAPHDAIDVGAFLDARRFSAFNVKLILISWAVTVFAGLDMAMISYTAPYFREEFHFSNASLGQVFSGGVLGMILGSVLLAYLGDRFGRRWPLAIGAGLAGLLAMATSAVQDPTQLMVLRFLQGMSTGGIVPLVWTVNIEYVPRRMRASIVTLVMFGYSVGTAIGAPLTNVVAPLLGWRGVYLLGGALTVFAALPLFFWMPESVRYLAVKGKRPDLIVCLLNRLVGRTWVSTQNRFYDSGGAAPGSVFRPRDLFAGRLKFLTPAIWIGFIASSLAVYLTTTWGPSILEAMDLPRRESANIVAAGTFLGSLAGLSLMRVTDRFGPRFMAISPALAVLALLGIAFAGVTQPWLVPLLVIGQLLIMSSHYSIMSVAGVYYPTAIRANGAGWASAVAKIGGVTGPLAGAQILSLGLPASHSFAFLAVCPAVLAIMALWLGTIVRESAATPD